MSLLYANDPLAWVIHFVILLVPSSVLTDHMLLAKHVYTAIIAVETD